MEKKILFFIIIISLLLFAFINIKALLKIQGDGVFYYSWAHSVLWDHDFNFTNELEYYAPYDIQSALTLSYKTTPLDKTINPYAYGMAIMLLPFVFMAHVLTLIFHNFNAEFFALDGYSYFYNLFVNFASWFYGLLAVWINYKVLKSFFSQETATKSVLAIWLATPWIYYQFLEPSMAHIISLFLVSWFLFLMVKIWQGNRVNFWLLGLVIFLMVVTRWQNIIFLLPLIFLIKDIFRKSVFIITPIIIWFISQMAVWKLLYGRFILIPQGQGFLRWDFHGLYILFSTNRGLLLWSPILILAIVGWFYLMKKSKFLGLAVLVVFIGQWLVNGSLNDLGGGDAFGARRFIEVLPFFVLALGALFEKLKKYRWLVGIVIILFICWNFLLMENYRVGSVPHTGEFNFFEINYFQVVERDLNRFF